MHIVFTANTSWNIWNFRRPLLKAFLADGHRITVIAPPDETCKMLSCLGCSVRPLAMDAKGLNPLGGLALARRFHGLFKTDRPDVVLSYTIKNNLFATIAARRLNVPVIPNVTGLGTAFLSGGFLQHVAEFLYRRAFDQLGVVFFQNADDRDLFIERRLVRKDQAQLLPGSGIDLEYFAAANLAMRDDAPVFLMIARLLRDKGVEEFVEAARMVRKEHSEARFQLLGAIGSENRTAIDEIRVRGWVAEGVVEYLGTASDVRPAIADATCVVLPSYREGAPRTLIEAASMARPLITTDVPGCRSVVDPDISGFLCEARNSESLAGAIRRFLDLSRDERLGMGQAGRAKMEKEFSETRVVSAYRDAIRDVVKAG
jgi:glycosyltransferase involved in cell wall biosynthesis